MKISNTLTVNTINCNKTVKSKNQTLKTATCVDSFQKISFKANPATYSEKLLKRYITDLITNINSAPEAAIKRTFTNILKETNINEALQKSIVSHVDKSNGEKTANEIIKKVVNTKLNNREKYNLFDSMKFACHGSSLYTHGLDQEKFIYDRNEIQSLCLTKTNLWEKAKKQPEVFMIFKPLETVESPVTVESSKKLLDKIKNAETRANKLLNAYRKTLKKTFLPEKRSFFNKLLRIDNYNKVMDELTYDHKYDFGKKLVWQAMDETLKPEQFKNLAKIMPREVFNAYSGTDEKFIEDTVEFFIKNPDNKTSFTNMASSFKKPKTYTTSSSEVHQGWFDYSDWP